MQSLYNTMLFHVQGVGSIKKVGGFDVYVKEKHCEDTLKDIIKELKQLIVCNSVSFFVLVEDYRKYVEDIQDESNGTLFYQRF